MDATLFNTDVAACWEYVLACLAAAYATTNAGYAIGEDDHGMATASACDLIEWVADLESRLGLDVDNLRGAVFDFIDARDSDMARGIVAEAFGDASQVSGHDPRGIFVAGAEVERPAGTYNPVGFYMYDDGSWVVATYDDNGEHDAMCNGRGYFDRAQVVALLREKFAAARGNA